MSIAAESKTHFKDFVSELPYDIITTVLLNLSSEQLLECLHVSTVWNLRLLNNPILWRDVELTDADARLVKTLECLAPFIKKLTICDNVDQEATFRLLSKSNFDNLKSLALKLEMPEASVYDDYIYPALSNVGSCLEEVSFNYLDYVKLPFTRILDYCPNLERMKYNGFTTSIGSGAVSNNTSSKVTHAFIHIDTQVDPGELKRFLQRTPKLQQLHISYCMYEILDVIFECCPDLPYLNYNMAAMQQGNEVRMEFADFQVGEERGMRVLDVVESASGIPMNIAQFTQTSEVLEEFGFVDCWGIDRLPDFASTILRRFHWDASIGPTSLSSIVSQCPLIQDVMLTHVNAECLFILIRQLAQLRKLHLTGAEDVEEHDMQRFLMYCKSSNSLVLNTLVLDRCRSVTDATIGYLADLPTLREITLKDNDNVTEAGMNMFVEKLQYSNVSHIQLGTMDAVTDVTLARLGAAHLETVSLLALDHVTFHGLCELVDHAPSLRQLHVFDCGDIENSALSAFNGIKVCTTKPLS
ncbi:hypothetical protein BJV82DRAFT_619059 [Fennellomyces sp. T-0311]|nr:hypothetical protein BJV82DRAFT_619059 [Fennellomyces sp. T-0311]